MTMSPGKLYKECIGRRQFTYPAHIKRTLDEARETFPMTDKLDRPICSETLKWFVKWFGEEEKIKALLDGYFAEYLKAHLRNGKDGTAH